MSNNDQRGFLTTKRTAIYSTFLKSTIDAAVELIFREGVLLSDERIAEIAKLESAKYSANIKILYNPQQKDLEDIVRIYEDQWIDSYVYLQEKMKSIL